MAVDLDGKPEAPTKGGKLGQTDIAEFGLAKAEVA